MTNQVANNFGASKEMSLRFTASSSAAAASKINILPGVGVSADKSLPSNITYAGDFATWADFVDYMRDNELTITEIRLQTDNVNNFAGKLTVTERNPNMQSNAQQVWQLSKYRESNGATYADTLTIGKDALGGGIVTKPRVNFAFENLLASSFVQVTFVVGAWDKGSNQTPY